MKKKNTRSFLPLSKKGLAALLGFTITALPVSNAFAVTPPTTQNSNIIVSDDFAWAKSVMSENSSTISIDMAQHFPRLDANSLNLTAESSQQDVLNSEVSGKSLILKMSGYGTTNVEVTATDQTGLNVVETFQVTIDRLGDIDGDGVVTSSDALFVSKVVKGLITVSPEEKKKYDINKDGSVTNADVTALMSLIASQKNGTSSPQVSENSYVVSMRDVNDAPIGLSKQFSVNEDTELKPESSLAADGIDVENHTLYVTSTSQPAHGTLTLKDDGTFTYLPESNFNGLDTFTYKITDGAKESASVTVTIDVLPVNDNPVADNQILMVTEDTPANGMLFGVDIDSTSLTYQLVTNGTKGTAVITNPATGAFTYMPNDNANGTDSFTFKISDGTGESNTATVTIEIAAVNDAPSAVSDQYSTMEDEALTVSAVSGLLTNDTDVDEDSLTAILVSGTAHGSLTLNSDGSFQYKPDDNFYGNDGFTYKVNDGTTDSNVVTVTLHVTPVNDLPWAQGGTIQVREDTPLNGMLTGGDIDSTSLTYQLVTNGTKGTVVITNPATGAFTYTPNNNANGTDSFTFKISDGTGESNTAKVTVVIEPVNDNPIAVPDQYTTNEDETLTVSAVSGLLTNDTDADEDSLTAILVSGTTHGSLSLNSDGSFQYKPDDNFYGNDSFTYKVNDGTTDSNVVTVTLHVTPVNDLPWAQGGTIQVTEDTPLNGMLTGGDIDSTSLTYQLVTNGTKGTVVITNPATGAYTYTPKNNANGTDSFTFKISDGIGESDIVVMNVVIHAVNDLPTVLHPIANQELVTGTAETKLTITNLFTDVDGDNLVYSAVSSNASIVVVSIVGTELILTPVTAGTATITITANDGNGGIETTSFSVKVTNPNSAPVVEKLLSNINTSTGSAASTIDLAGTFSDADHDVLTYSATSSDPSSATATVTGNSLTITPLAAGTATITVTAVDGNGGSALTSFTVTVEAAKNVTMTATLFDPGELTEANLKAAMIVLTLDGDTFKDTATEADFRLNNAPAGLTLGPALMMGNEAYLILDYDGPDFDADIPNFSITALGSATESGNSIQSSNLTIKAIQEPNGPVFISEYLQNDNGRVAIEIFNKGLIEEPGYSLEVYQYNTKQNKKSSISLPLFPVQPNMTYNIINSIFYDFFEIIDTWYYNNEMMLSGDGLINTAIILKKNGVVVDAIGNPNSTSAILPNNGTMVRKHSFAGGMASYQEYQWSFFPNGTLQYFGRHTP